MSDTRFDACLQFVLKWEGGFSDDPDDPGGATNLGIIQTEYDAYRQHKGLPTQSVKSITHAEAAEIYTNNYWIPLKCPNMTPPLDLVMFDTGVNMGVRTAVRFLQTCLHVTVDGDFGPKTQAALDARKSNIKPLVSAYLAARETRYHEIVAAHPKLGKFIKGWLNRLNDLRNHVL
jgi:lysozyme family protein